jgi:biopolymer transport protein ExbD
MSLSQGSQFDNDEALMNEINMTPLIDVMLVLLIIFIITIPVINKAIKVDLPKGDAQLIAKKDESVDVSITADGSILWDKEVVSDTDLPQRVQEAAGQNPPPVLRIYADRAVAYERVVHLLTTAQKGGLAKLDFVTTPPTSTP